MEKIDSLKDVGQYVAEVVNLFNQKKLQDATDAVLKALELFPNHNDLLVQACNIYVALGDYQNALIHAEALRVHHPAFYGGHARSAQYLNILSRRADAIQIITEALEKFPVDLWVLFTALNLFNAEGEYEKSCALGASLLEHHPSFVHFYPVYADSLYHLRQDERADEIINVAYSRFPKEPIAIRLKLDLLFRRREYSLYRSWLYRLVAEMPSFVNEAIERLHAFEHTIANRTVITRREHDCDVICIASNEAEYIAEFIHHYLYLGFANIFVGINHTSDKTLEILSKIREVYPNVHFVDVDHTIPKFLQYGCYRVLFDHAKNLSLSKYALFVDVDEFWIADRFPRKISEFIADSGPFDVYSFHWIVCFGESLFSPPLALATSYSWHDHVKSICSYDVEVIDFKCHAPILAHSDEIIIKKGISVNKNFKSMISGKGGIIVDEISRDPASSPIGEPGLAWVMHRVYRSELEYTFRLFRASANQPADRYFKKNRWGYKPLPETPGSFEYVTQMLPQSCVDQYHASLKTFIKEVDIEGLLNDARARINEENCYEKLKSIPPDILLREAALLRATFSGTRFYDWIVKTTKR